MRDFFSRTAGDKINFPKTAKTTFFNKKNVPFESVKFWSFDVLKMSSKSTENTFGHWNANIFALLKNLNIKLICRLRIRGEKCGEKNKNTKIFLGKMQSSFSFKLERRNNQQWVILLRGESISKKEEAWQHFKPEHRGRGVPSPTSD